MNTSAKNAILIIPKEFINFIGEHGKQEYPHEACGIILGIIEESGEASLFRAHKIVRAVNLSDNPFRFVMDPMDFLRAQDEADKNNIEIIGIYHTHPDHPPAASQYDLEAAIEGLFYLIVSVRNGEPKDYKGWILDPSNKAFIEAQVQVV